MNNKPVMDNQKPQESVIYNDQNPEPKFAVDLQVFIELQTKNKQQRAVANVLGWHRPRHLIISYPLVDNRILRAANDAELVVRYLLDGVVYGFTTKIIHKQQDPFPMWVLNFPSVVQTKTLRRSPRINIVLPVNNADGHQFRTVDISGHGALLSTNADVSLGEEMNISFTLPDGTQIEQLHAEVVRIQQSKEETMLGVNFDNQDTDQLGKISSYLYGQQLSENAAMA